MYIQFTAVLFRLRNRANRGNCRNAIRQINEQYLRFQI